MSSKEMSNPESRLSLEVKQLVLPFKNIILPPPLATIYRMADINTQLEEASSSNGPKSRIGAPMKLIEFFESRKDILTLHSKPVMFRSINGSFDIIVAKSSGTPGYNLDSTQYPITLNINVNFQVGNMDQLRELENHSFEFILGQNKYTTARHETKYDNNGHGYDEDDNYLGFLRQTKENIEKGKKVNSIKNIRPIDDWNDLGWRRSAVLPYDSIELRKIVARIIETPHEI